MSNALWRGTVMEEILNNMGFPSYEIAIDSNNKCYLHLANLDKIIFICEISDLKLYQYISTTIPKLRKNFSEYLKDKVNDDIFDKDRLPIPKFLWDLYVIGIHKISNENEPFNPIDVADIERDHFAARKIIIEYVDYNELKEKILHVINPNQQLDLLMMGLKDASSSVMGKLLNGIDLKLVFSNTQHPDKKDVTFEHLFSFLEEAQRVVTPESGD